MHPTICNTASNMASKLNINKIESYSQAVAEKICNDIFANKRAVSGKEILSLTSIEQINFFVLKSLFEKWNEENNKLRSPYFNYDQEEVKEALAVLSNKLSNNILVEREFLKPLLSKAVAESLHWIIFPEDYLATQYSLSVFINYETIKDASKYFKINKFLIDKTLIALEQQGRKDGFSKEYLIGIFHDIVALHQHQLSDVAEWLEKYGAILSFDLSDLVAAIQKTNSFFDELEVHKTEPTTTTAEDITTETVALEDREIIPVRTVLPPTIDNPVNIEARIVNDQFAKANRTLNEMLTQHQNNATVNERMAQSKIHDLRSAITLNKRFQIINELFKGNTGEYLFAIEDIENSVSHTDALQILQDKFATKYNWTFEDDLLKEFLQLIQRRFM